MRTRNTRRVNFLSKMFIIIVIFTTAILLIDSYIRPIVKTIAAYQGREIATRIINQSVYNALSNSDTDYENLVSLSYNNNGSITSVKTNVSQINKLQSEISIAINSEIDKISDSTIEIALGTFSGLSFFNGQGPIIKFKIKPIGFVKTQLASEFTSAGINQTLHKITLNVSVSVTAIVPGNSTNFDVLVNYIIADTIVVGEIPDGYTYITGDNRDTISKANDYSATD